MIHTDLTEYDVKPIEMVNYLRYHGPHFSKKLCKYAVSLMSKDGPILAYTKEQVDNLLGTYGIELKNKGVYDYVFVANMCKADFLGSSIPDELHLALYVKDLLSDPDGYDGLPFNRWLADMAKKGETIDWEEMV